MLAFVIAVMALAGRRGGLRPGGLLALAFGVWASPTRSTSTRSPSAPTASTRCSTRPGRPRYVLVALAACRPAERLDARRLRARHARAARGRARCSRSALLVFDHYYRPATWPRVWLATRRDRDRGRALRADLPREPALARRQRDRGGDRRADRARQPARADARPRRRAERAERPDCSRCSTSTASRPTTTRFGHPAGDALLARLGASLTAARRRRTASAYRMGGDEFCLLATDGDAGRARARRGAALSEPRASGFTIGCSLRRRR